MNDFAIRRTSHVELVSVYQYKKRFGKMILLSCKKERIVTISEENAVIFRISPFGAMNFTQ